MTGTNNESRGISTNYRTRDEVQVFGESTSKQNNNIKNTNEAQSLSEELVASISAQLSETQQGLDKALKELNKINVEKERALSEVAELQKTMLNRERYQRGLTTRINNLTAELEIATKKLNAVDSDNQSEEHLLLIEQVSQLTKELEDTKSSLSDARKTVNSLSQKYNGLIRKSEQAVKVVDKHEGLVEALETSKAEIIRLEEVLQSERNTTSEQSVLLLNEIEVLNKKLTAIKNRDDIDSQVQLNTNKKIEELTKRANEAEALLQQYEAKAQVAVTQEQQLTGYESQVLELENQLATANKELENLQAHVSKIEAMEQEKLILESQLNDANNRANEMAVKLEGYGEIITEVEKLRIENESMGSNLKAIVNEFELYKTEHSNCVSLGELSQLQLEQQTLLNQISELKSKLSLTERENEKLQLQVNEIMKDGDPAMIQELQEKAHELEKTIAVQQQQMETLNNLCNQAEEVAKEYQAKANAFSDLVEFYNKVLEDISKNNPQASDAFDKTAERYIMPYIHIIDYM